MKKVFALLLTGLLAVTLCACDGGKGAASASPSPSASASPSASPTAKASPKTTAKPTAKPSAKPGTKATAKPVENQESSQVEVTEPPATEAPESSSEVVPEPTPDYVHETPAPVPDDVPTENIRPDDFIGRDINEFVAAFGSANSVEYAPSCMGSGKDGIWTYSSYTVYTFQDDTGYEYITSIA